MESEVNGMGNVITSITSSLSADTLWGVVGSIVPLLAITTVVALGFWLVKRQTKKVTKFKGGV